VDTNRDFARAAPKLPDAADAVMNGDIPALVRIFTLWRQRSPDVKGVAASIIEKFDFSPQRKDIVLRAADLAAEPNEHPFHNNRHFLEVFTMAALLGNHALKKGDIKLDGLALLLTAALTHDHKHDGKTNGNIQYRLERHAFDHVKDPLRIAGVNGIELEIIRGLFFATDVSKDFLVPQAISPSDSLKIFSQTKNTKDLKPELHILIDAGMIDAALMLVDADLSGGMIDPQLSHDSGQRFDKEQGKPYDVKNQIFFLDKIAHRRAFSKAGVELIQPHLNIVLKDFGLTAPSPDVLKKSP